MALAFCFFFINIFKFASDSVMLVLSDQIGVKYLGANFLASFALGIRQSDVSGCRVVSILINGINICCRFCPTVVFYPK